MVNEFRHKRLESSIYRRFITMQNGEIKDPVIKNLHITHVEATPDLKKVVIYYRIEENTDIESVERSYKKAAGFLRRNLVSEIKLKYVPRIELKPDYGEYSENRIEEILKNEKRNTESDP